MNYYEEALKLNADGIDFVSCGEFNKRFPKVNESYTIEQLKEQTCFPRSCRLFYKIIDGKKEYLENEKRKIIDENPMIRASNKAGLTRNQLLDTLFEKGVLAVYNLGMQHMYEYLEEK